MSAFELQTYKSGRWEIDSYYDDRDLALSEAERLDVTGRHGGVRVVEENYDEATNRSTYHVVFSKMKKIAGGGDDWRARAQRAQRRSASSSGPASGETRSRSRPTRPAPRRNTNLYIVIVLAAVLLFGGIAAMIGLQEVAKLL